MTTCPTGKHAYITPAEAANAVRLIEQRNTRHKKLRYLAGGRLKHYHCAFCGAWHIGHTKPEGRRA